jgi:hypothetical protein
VRNLIASVAGPRSWSDTRESWLNRAAKRAGISFRQVKSIWYGEITDKNHRSVRLMRDAAEKYSAISQAIDPVIYREEVAALLDLARKLRDQDNPGQGSR